MEDVRHSERKRSYPAGDVKDVGSTYKSSLRASPTLYVVFQRRVEGKRQLERINQLTPERADIETDSDSPTSPMSEHQQLEEPSRTVNDVLRHPPTNQPQVLPKNAKILSSTQGTQGMQL